MRPYPSEADSLLGRALLFYYFTPRLSRGFFNFFRDFSKLIGFLKNALSFGVFLWYNSGRNSRFAAGKIRKATGFCHEREKTEELPSQPGGRTSRTGRRDDEGGDAHRDRLPPPERGDRRRPGRVRFGAQKTQDPEYPDRARRDQLRRDADAEHEDANRLGGTRRVGRGRRALQIGVHRGLRRRDGAGRSAAAVEVPADTLRRHDTLRRPGDGRGKPPRKGRRHSVPARDGKKPRPLRPPLDPLPRF